MKRNVGISPFAGFHHGLFHGSGPRLETIDESGGTDAARGDEGESSIPFKGREVRVTSFSADSGTAGKITEL
jgi:hypothetical protein